MLLNNIKLAGVIAIAIVVATLLSKAVLTQQTPGEPHQFEVNLTVNGKPPDYSHLNPNWWVTAVIKNDMRTDFFERDERNWMRPPRNFTINDSGNNRSGKIIEFYITNIPVMNITFQNGAYTYLNLSAEGDLGRCSDNFCAGVGSYETCSRCPSDCGSCVGNEIEVTLITPKNNTAINSNKTHMNITTNENAVCEFILRHCSIITGCGNDNEKLLLDSTGSQNHSHPLDWLGNTKEGDWKRLIVECAGESLNAKNVTVDFYVDSVPPAVNITSPASNSNLTANSVWLNVSTDENANCTYWETVAVTFEPGGDCSGGCPGRSGGGGGSRAWNMSNTGGILHSQLIENITEMGPNGYNKLHAECTDSAANSNTSQVTFHVDASPPIITLHSPTNKSYNTNTLEINVSINEPVSVKVSHVSPETVTLCEACMDYNNTHFINWPDGSQRLTIYAIDYANNSASQIVEFTVDTVAPSINITSLVNNSNISRSSFWLNLTTGENALCSYTLKTCNTSFVGDSVRDTLQEGEGHQYGLDGIEYLIRTIFVGSTSAKFSVNGELTTLLTENGTHQFSDGTRITLIDAIQQEYAGGTRAAEFLFNTTGRSDYCHNQVTSNMDVTGNTSHSQLVTEFSNTGATQYNLLIAVCYDIALNTNNASIKFYADTQTPLILNGTISFLNDTSAIIEWVLSEWVNRTFEYGLNTSYGFSSYESTRWKTPYVILKNLTPGTRYFYQITFFDTFGNSNASKGSFSTKLMENIRWNVMANETAVINSSATNTTLDIVTKSNIANVSINITSSRDSPTSKSLNISGLKYLDIDVDEALTQAMSSVLLKIQYSDDELLAQNVSESTLGIYWYNFTLDQWVKLTASLGWVYGTGVDTEKNYVWANVSHFSSYGVGGLTANGYTCSSNSQCASNYCSNNICSNPPSDNSNTPSNNGGGSGGGGGGGGGLPKKNETKNLTQVPTTKNITENKSKSSPFEVTTKPEPTTAAALNLTQSRSKTEKPFFSRITGFVTALPKTASGPAAAAVLALTFAAGIYIGRKVHKIRSGTVKILIRPKQLK